MNRKTATLTKDSEQILNLIQNRNKIDITEEHTIEWIRCRDNPLYFILNYVYLPVVGAKPVKYTPELLHPKFRRIVRSIFRYHKCILMASRQLGKSSIAACLIAWAITFYPNNSCVILNMRKDAAQLNLKKVKFIINHLPPFMRIPPSSRSEIKTYFELQNGSRIDTYYPSPTTPPDTLSRSLTVPILYIDEVAFIPHIDEIYGAAQPTLSTARTQAELAGHPWFILLTSTPNGIEGNGKFFYNMWSNAVDSDELFVMNDEKNNIEDWISEREIITRLNDRTKNGFIKVKYHWSENPDRDLAWYEEQKRELNFDQRRINQELDLLFVGSSNCIFDDETLAKFQPLRNKIYVDLANQVKLRVFGEIDISDYYLIGVDTASSLKGSFNAIEVFTYRNFVQFAEAHTRLGSLVKYGEVIDSLFKWLFKQVGSRIILCIENNSIGKAIIEHLLYHVKDFNYIPYIYKDYKSKQIPGMPVDKSNYEYGINTNAKTKELMVSLLYDYIKNSPQNVKSEDFINQLSTIERSSRGTISSRSFSDMFMAASFCAYVRKMTALEILPLLGYTNEQIQKNFFDTISNLASMMNVKTLISQQESNVIQMTQSDDLTVLSTDDSSNLSLDDQDWIVYMPIMPFK